MKKQDLKNLRTKTTQELETLIKERVEEMAKLKIDQAMKKNKNVHLYSAKRKDIAQILTVLKEKKV